MTMNVNEVNLIGNLARDPELRYTTEGTAVATLTVATNERYKDKSSNEYKSKAQFHRVTVWGPQAENCNKWLVKGQEVKVEGSLENTDWTDKDGIRRYQTHVKALRVKFGAKSKAQVISSQDDTDMPTGF